MSYSANQYNYATPLSSITNLTKSITTGSQMLDFDAWIASFAGIGITRGTYTIDSLGKFITVTATANDAFTPYDANAFRIQAKPNTSYTLSCKRHGDAGRVFLFDSGSTTNMVESIATDTDIRLTLTTGASTSFITFRVGVQLTGGVATFSEIMICEGTISKPYERYSNLIAYPRDTKFFDLSDNKLDGTYFPITDDVGLWGTSVSNASGVLPVPLVVTVLETLTINAYRLVGSQYNYPVAFTVKLYNGSTLLYTITETANTQYSYVHLMPRVLTVTSYEITITKISAAGSAARLYNSYNPAYVKRYDVIRAKASEIDTLGLKFNSSDYMRIKSTELRRPINETIYAVDSLKAKETSVGTESIAAKAYDTLRAKETSRSTIANAIHTATDILYAKHVQYSALENRIGLTSDRLMCRLIEPVPTVRNIIDVANDALIAKVIDLASLTNVHSKMKEPSRQIYGKVYITYTDPILDSGYEIVTSDTAYNAQPDQLVDGSKESISNLFNLYKNDLTGAYVISDQYAQVGWVSSVVSDASGNFSIPQAASISFTTRPLTTLTIIFNPVCVPVNFTVTFGTAGGNVVKTFTNNMLAEVQVLDEAVPEVSSILISISKVSKANYPAIIIDIPVISTIEYVGYQDKSDLMSIDLLEELTYEDDVEALGGVSANEVTVVLDNSNKQFFFNNAKSLIANQLKRNRKIEPWLGTEVIPGEIEWYKLGTYWSYKWSVPVNSLSASVVGFDTIGLLSLTSFMNHEVQHSKSIGELIEYVLADATLTFDFIEYSIDPALYEVIIPYAWFALDSHAAALRKISQCYPMHIYCDRDGRICAAPQKLHQDFYYDVWADNTNVVSKTYDSLYTTLPNIINVVVNDPLLLNDQQLVLDEVAFDVTQRLARTLNFSAPYDANLVVNIDCDDTVNYTYSVYSWGIRFAFTGTGNVRSIECRGTVIDMQHSSVLTRRDEDSILTNGAVTRDVKADFIQTSGLAMIIINRLFSLADTDKYDAVVDYRGDIALTINDPILLQDGIAPDNRYNIKRHQLSWNGSLTGSAYLNT